MACSAFVGFGKSKGKCGEWLGGNIFCNAEYGGKPGGKNEPPSERPENMNGNGLGGVDIAAAAGISRTAPVGVESPGDKPELDESQKRLCLDKDVTVPKVWPHFVHLICIRQSACIRLCRHRFENCVYALKQTSHWNGLTEE